MKKPWLAFLLNFLLAGAGLAYLGMWGWAVLNLAVVLLLGFVLAATAPDSIGPLSAGLAAASGGLAMALAQSMNAKGASPKIGQQFQPAGPPPYFPPLPAQPFPARARFCGDCGADAGASKFCPQCGSQMHEAAPEPFPFPELPPLPVAASSPGVAGARAKFCGDCGADAGASKFCPQCGAKMLLAALPANPPRPPLAVPQPLTLPQAMPLPRGAVASAARAKFCGDCGAETGASKFCPQCGSNVQSLVPSEPRCAGCGSVFQLPAKFCPDCGTRVGA